MVEDIDFFDESINFLNEGQNNKVFQHKTEYIFEKQWEEV